ncbi:hypothetical protein WISP_18120 [Willisornis vidua]|uniref:Uncharacterized protein n=1 Tax=Willisornis vidua TaxID=1566151 RepID=A0ABQ9DV24_9PASS|nr:hypothetical protein WISP_18120 [Willisornis vidua]
MKTVKVVKGLESKPYEKSLRSFGLVSLEKMRFRGDPIAVYSFHKRGRGGADVDLFTLVLVLGGFRGGFCEKTPEVASLLDRTSSVLAGFKRDLPLAKAKRIMDLGSTSAITHLRRLDPMKSTPAVPVHEELQPVKRTLLKKPHAGRKHEEEGLAEKRCKELTATLITILLHFSGGRGDNRRVGSEAEPGKKDGVWNITVMASTGAQTRDIPAEHEEVSEVQDEDGHITNRDRCKAEVFNVFFVFNIDDRQRASQYPELEDHDSENDQPPVKPEIVWDLQLQWDP